MPTYQVAMRNVTGRLGKSRITALLFPPKYQIMPNNLEKNNKCTK